MSSTFKKILIIRFSSIGDIVLTTPVIRCVKNQTGAELYFLTKPQYFSLIRNNPYLTQVLNYEDSILPDLKKMDFDLIIDLHHNLRSLKVKSYLGVKSIAFNKINVRKWMKVNLNIDLLPDKHLVDRYFDALKEIGVTNDGKGLDFYVDENISDKSRQLINRLDPYCCLVLGANYFTKRIPKSKCLEIIEQSKIHVMLIGGKDVLPLAEELSKAFPEKTINMCGQINLQESACMLKSADHVITGDTGMMHIATAFHKRIFILWGNTIPGFGMYPYYGEKYLDRHIDLEIEDLSCRPCSKLGFNSCPKEHFQCMTRQDVSRIIHSQ